MSNEVMAGETAVQVAQEMGWQRVNLSVVVDDGPALFDAVFLTPQQWDEYCLVLMEMYPELRGSVEITGAPYDYRKDPNSPPLPYQWGYPEGPYEEPFKGYSCECGCGCTHKVWSGTASYCSACAVGCCGE